MSKPLFAGTLSAVPVSLTPIGSRGQLMARGEDGASCWTDPTGSILLPDLNAAISVMRAHGYEVDRITLAVSKPVAKPTPTALMMRVLPHPVPQDVMDVLLHIAGSVPAAEPGDQIDINRYNIAWAVWQGLSDIAPQAAPILLLPAKPSEGKGKRK